MSRNLAFDPASWPLFPACDTLTSDAVTWSILATSAESLSLSQCTLIKRVRFCKCSTGKHHQFLIVELAGNERATSILVERGGTLKNTSSSNLSPPLTHSSAASSTVSLSSISTIKAFDRVTIPAAQLLSSFDTIIEADHGIFLDIHTLDCSANTTVSAADLAALLLACHTLCPDYELCGHQCYWYSDIVYETIKSLTGGIDTAGKEANKRGKLHSLSPTQGAVKSLKEIEQAYRTQLEHVQNKWATIEPSKAEEYRRRIDIAFAAEKQALEAKAAKAEEQRDRETARAKEIMRRAEEATAKAEEQRDRETARADGEQAAAQDLQRKLESMEAKYSSLLKALEVMPEATES